MASARLSLCSTPLFMVPRQSMMLFSSSKPPCGRVEEGFKNPQFAFGVPQQLASVFSLWSSPSPDVDVYAAPVATCFIETKWTHLDWRRGLVAKQRGSPTSVLLRSFFRCSVLKASLFFVETDPDQLFGVGALAHRGLPPVRGLVREVPLAFPAPHLSAREGCPGHCGTLAEAWWQQ